MGARINMENRQDEFERRLKLVEGALEELLQNGTKVHHVDLTTEVTDKRNVVAEGTKIKEDTGDKKLDKKKSKKSEVVESLL